MAWAQRPCSGCNRPQPPCNWPQSTQSRMPLAQQMPRTIGNAWSEFGHVRFENGHSAVAMGCNLHSAAWLGRNGRVRVAIGHSPLAIGHNPHSAACPWCSKWHVRISGQSAMFGPFPALCGANAANVCALHRLRSASIARPAGVMHTTHTQPPSAHAHQHKHIAMHRAMKSNQMHYAYHMNRSNQTK